ncbi:FtsW/RodA/SpoVE family cell cycle protein [Konateibacter massiliensis]|uniref:FtsW/RodA/SpoVE family cell cycle protein n=1 Tax=Konateibacter massiliensis TaxID=2002841 RepID=UPI000C159CE3|nr:FtsW/RodA/SpoVE family cell cycle protein [Konateibacter massiliensis]
MTNILIELSRYLIIIAIAIYTYKGFAIFRFHEEEDKNAVLRVQNQLMFAIHFMAFLVLFLTTKTTEIIILYLAQVIFLSAVIALYRVIYPKASRLIINHMCMLLAISFIILTRLSYTKSIKQFKIVIISTIITLFIPYLIKKLKFLDKLGYVYAGVGIGLLGLVAIAGSISYGAKLSFSIGGVSLQPSEFIKITFVFFAAALLSKSQELKQLIIVTGLAGLHVLILVASKDLGGALIYFITYTFMLYVASKEYLYLTGGLLAGAFAALAGYKLFSHVRVRVIAWQDPFRVIENEGYQISQSLFAIGTGGWFGMGLYQGIPDTIPVVDQDFIFSAIVEELGGIFGLCLILICVSCFVMFVNIAMQAKDDFYRLVALGLALMYGFQVFLTIGGVTKFIPLTGVTLPLVSYGGSSILSTLIMFAIIQGLYILKQDEDEKVEKVKSDSGRKTRQTEKKKKEEF